MPSQIEVELRYKIDDAEAAVALLAVHDTKLEKEQHIIDRWFIPKTVRSRKEHDVWFDEEHGLAYRIRFSEDENGQSTILDSKQHTEANNHNTFKEDTLPLSDLAEMEKYLDDEGYYNWLTIDKTRKVFSSSHADLAITMDSIGGIKDEIGVDTVLEVEYSGEASRDEALQIITDFASKLGLDEGHQFDKSLTVESMRVLAKFQ